MQWIGENWVVLLLVGGMIAMHLFGHGHGGHGGHTKDKPKPDAKTADDASKVDKDR